MTTKGILCSQCAAPLEIKLANSKFIKCAFCNTNNLLSTEIRQKIADTTGYNGFVKALMKEMDSAFSLESFKTFVVEYEIIDFDNLEGGAAKKNKIRELILHAVRRRELQYLVDSFLYENPDVDL